MLYMIFQHGLEPVLIQRILIGFEAILEINLIFLGKDHGVDYSKIDNNSELDDLNMEDQEKDTNIFIIFKKV